MDKLKVIIVYVITILNISIFGIGSFLCFIIAVLESQDRLLFGGVFLLLLTFVNQKIINVLAK